MNREEITAKTSRGLTPRLVEIEELPEHGWVAEGWTLPRLKAVENLTATLERRGVSDGAAGAVARAVVQPDDARRRLNELVELRVQGGTLLLIETKVWTAGVVPFPTNPRELGHRLYPLGVPTRDGAPRLIADPVQTPGRNAELTLRVDKPELLAARLRDAEEWLNVQNPLADDIAAEGVLQPLALVMMTVQHEDGNPPVAVLTAADGSSRITAAHRLLAYDPAELTYGTAEGDRAFRQLISRILRLVRERGWDGLSSREQRQVRALTAPARIIIGFEPEPGRGVTFDAAVRNLIGLTHIRPPQSYGPAVENDAKADAVLDALTRPLATRPGRITDDERLWYAGMLSPHEAEQRGFPHYPDVRAADITRALLHGGRATAARVNAGIRSLTARRSPSPNERVDIAVELMLRTVRTEHAAQHGYSIQARRAALQRCYRLPEITKQPDEPLLEGFDEAFYTLDELRDAALEEVREGQGDDGTLGCAQVELATKAAYYMVTAEPMALRRELVGRDEHDPQDERALSVVLRAMLSTERGVHQAYAVILAGRRQTPLFEVDEDGGTTRDGDGQLRVLTDQLIRSTYTGRPSPKGPTTGAAGAARRWRELVTEVDRLEYAVKNMQAVPSDSGRSVVDEQGWPAPEVRKARDRLDWVSRRLARWADRHQELHDEEAGTDGLETE
jgi:hypothetical protein